MVRDVLVGAIVLGLIAVAVPAMAWVALDPSAYPLRVALGFA